MKINILDIRESASYGGINSQLIRVFPGLRNDNEINITFSYLSDSPNDWLLKQSEQIGLDLIELPYKGPHDVGVIHRLADLINKKKVDIVHTQGFRGNILARLVLDFKLANFKTIITKHGTAGERGLIIDFYIWLDIRPTKLANAIVAVDDNTYNRMINLGVKKDRLFRIDNPSPIPGSLFLTDLEKEKIKNDLSISQKSKIILYLGRIVKNKGVFDLLNAFSILKNLGHDVVLLFVGNGSYLGELIDRTRKLNLTRYVYFLGFKYDIKRFLCISDMIILPSYSEGTPNIILEAMASKIPVIATNIGGIPSIIADKDTGLLFTPGNIDELVNKINLVLSNNALSNHLVNNALINLTKYSPYKIGRDYINLYKKVYRMEK